MTATKVRSGVYNVKEMGLEYQHLHELPTPRDGEEFLERFRYVLQGKDLKKLE